MLLFSRRPEASVVGASVPCDRLPGRMSLADGFVHLFHGLGMRMRMMMMTMTVCS